MLTLILWYLLVFVTGLAALPLAFRLLPALPDRGYAFVKALGLLLWGYIFWLLTSLNILQNNSGGELLAFAGLLALSAWAAWGGRFREILTWLRDHRKYVISTELVFLLAFLLWAFVRSANPYIINTEKPMELAFINAILRSPTFPPHDPWLSGYAISYYYFGYVIVAMLVRLTGASSGVGFNLAISMVFALTALGAYGLVANLLALWKAHAEGKQAPGEKRRWKLPLGLPLLGPFFILIVSNLEGFLDVLHARGLFWQQAADGTWTSSFWQWLNIQELTSPPPLPLSWMPSRPTGLLWWRASRVLQDFDLTGTSHEIIDEFPFFSYLLADLHPHVLTMPFALLILGMVLNVYLDRKNGHFQVLGLEIPLSVPSFLLGAVCLGGLAFLNTWDFPIYLALFSAAYTLRRCQQAGWRWSRIGDFIGLAAALGVSGVILYLPFYVGFTSQAGGPVPSTIFFTRGTFFWVMFAPLILPVFAYLIFLWRREGSGKALVNGLKVSLGLIAGLWLLSFAYAFAISLVPNVGSIFLDSQGALAEGIRTLLSTALVQRLLAPGTWITLAILIALGWGLLYRPKGESELAPEAQEPLPESIPSANPMLLLVVLFGALLVLAPEFFYLRDQFGTRMNTIFKFYFQAWILWGIAAAFGTAVLLQSLRRSWGVVYRAGLVVLFAMALAYPVFSLLNKTNNFNPGSGFTLDGNAYFDRTYPDDAAGINWLKSAAPGVVAEAVDPTGGDYTGYARVAMLSGDADVLGWFGHEQQWGRDYGFLNQRRTDLTTLYETANWDEALRIIQEYNIRYIYIGSYERSTYHVSENKFQGNLASVFQQGDVTIYEVPQSILPATGNQGN